MKMHKPCIKLIVIFSRIRTLGIERTGDNGSMVLRKTMFVNTISQEQMALPTQYPLNPITPMSAKTFRHHPQYQSKAKSSFQRAIRTKLIETYPLSPHKSRDNAQEESIGFTLVTPSIHTPSLYKNYATYLP